MPERPTSPSSDLPQVGRIVTRRTTAAAARDNGTALDGLVGLVAGAMSWTALLAMVMMPLGQSNLIVFLALAASVLLGLFAVARWMISESDSSAAPVFRAGAFLGGASILLVLCIAIFIVAVVLRN